MLVPWEQSRQTGSVAKELNNSLQMPIQQHLAAFKLYLLYSSLWLPSSYNCYKSAFGSLQALIATQHPLAAFKLCLLNNSFRLPIQQPLAAFKLSFLYSSLWLPSRFAC